MIDSVSSYVIVVGPLVGIRPFETTIKFIWLII